MYLNVDSFVGGRVVMEKWAWKISFTPFHLKKIFFYKFFNVGGQLPKLLSSPFFK